MDKFVEELEKAANNYAETNFLDVQDEELKQKKRKAAKLDFEKGALWAQDYFDNLSQKSK